MFLFDINMHLRLSSTDSSEYCKIKTTINALPEARFSRLTVTALTANCSIQVLSDDDYMTVVIGSTTCVVTFSDYTGLEMETWLSLLNNAFTEASVSITATNDNCGRVVLTASETFSINTVSYNVKLLMGLYSLSDSSFPITAEETTSTTYTINIDSCPYFLSTPILHLV